MRHSRSEKQNADRRELHDPSLQVIPHEAGVVYKQLVVPRVDESFEVLRNINTSNHFSFF